MVFKNYPHMSDRTPLQQLGNYWNLLIGVVIPKLQMTGFESNRQLLKTEITNGYGNELIFRWIACLVGGILSGAYIGMKAFIEVDLVKHIRGKRIIKSKKAFIQLQRDISGTKGSGLVFTALPEAKFNPLTMIASDLKKGTFIEFPEDRRRTHMIVMGGTGRGKTQFIFQTQVLQILNSNKRGIKHKAIFLDTPKNDYSNIIFDKKMCAKIAPHEEGSVQWNISLDLDTALKAKTFWEGKISVDPSEPLWGTSAIILGTGSTRYLQEIAPKAWNFGMLAYLLFKPADYIKPILAKVYPEANQILNGATETLGSMLQNLGSSSSDIVAIARIWNCYDQKKAVFQASTKALQHPKYIDFILGEMEEKNGKTILTKDEVAELHQWKSDEKTEDGNTESNSIAFDFTATKSLFKNTCIHLNMFKPNGWKWKDFVDQAQQETKGEYAPYYWTWLVSRISHYAEEWDKSEKEPTISIERWIVNDEPDQSRPILFLKPCLATPSLTTGLIRGILYLTNNVILGKLEDSKTRKFSILIDEFQSYGNIDFFVKQAFELYRSRGVGLTIAFQDLSQIDELYKQFFVPFITANSGSIAILGLNSGETCDRLSKLVGDRTVRVLNRTASFSDGKRNLSEHWTEQQQVVMSPSQFNIELGADTKDIKVLYLGNKLDYAYILDMPFVELTPLEKIRFVDMKNFTEPQIEKIQFKY
jgi:TraM recognition site of TraD and TraG/Type IV secretion-system coupling protein DNA-binding domain